MDYAQAMEERHTVRSYDGRPLPDDIVKKLNDRIGYWNSRFGLGMELRTEEEAFSPFIRLTMAKQARNFIILAGKDTEALDSDLGYAGADLVLFAKTIGLDSWWIGGTYNRGKIRKLVPGLLVLGIIVVGYGENHGKPHASKKPEDVSSYEGDRPRWFDDGVEAALLAPTALNKQDFMIAGKGEGVSVSYGKGVMSGIDRGIVRFFFETGAGKGSFHWTDGWTD